MKPITLLVALFCLGLSSLLAQTHQIEWGPAFRQAVQSTSGIAVVTSNGFYTYHLPYAQLNPSKVVRNAIELKYYNNDLVEIKRGEISLKYKEIVRSFERFLLLDNQLFMFSSYDDYKHKKQVLLVEKIKINKLTSEGMPIEIFSMPMLARNRSGEFEVTISRDSSKVLVYANNPKLEDQKEKSNFSVFDNHMQELWTHNEELPYEDRRFDMSNIKVSNKGNVILSATKTEIVKKTIFKEKISLKEVHFLIYLKNGTERQHYVVELDDRKIVAIEIELSPKGELICAGLYSNEDNDGILGTFLLRYDTKTKDLLAEIYSPFDEKIVGQLHYINTLTKDPRPITYILNDLILRKDGGIVLVAEIFHYSLVNSNSHVNYKYGEILVTSLDAEGEVSWYKLIKKLHVAPPSSTSSSYKLFVMPERLCIIYNDDKANHQEDTEYTQRWIGVKNSVVSLVTIHPDGNSQKEILLDSKDETVYIIPFLSLLHNNREIFLRAEKKSGSHYARVIFQ